MLTGLVIVLSDLAITGLEKKTPSKYLMCSESIVSRCTACRGE